MVLVSSIDESESESESEMRKITHHQVGAIFVAESGARDTTQLATLYDHPTSNPNLPSIRTSLTKLLECWCQSELHVQESKNIGSGIPNDKEGRSDINTKPSRHAETKCCTCEALQAKDNQARCSVVHVIVGTERATGDVFWCDHVTCT